MTRHPVQHKEEDEDETERRLSHYLAMLKSDDAGRRWGAAESLARLGDDRGVGPLIEALSDEDWRVRQKAAWALGYLGDPRAIVPLRMAMRDELEGVREIIEEAIRAITARMRGEEIPPPR
jgi:HEAT repeat protein